MLLIPFLENSFKHGHLTNGVLSIKIDLSCTSESIQFYIENTYIKSENTTKGIGLENMQKRLDLLYKDNYKLQIDDTNNLFKVTLKLNTN